MTSGAINMKLVTPGEAARLLNIREETLRHWCDTGVIPAFRVSGAEDRRLLQSDVIALRARMIGNAGLP